MLRPPKRLITALIIAFWLVMMGALLYREAWVPWYYRGAASKRITSPQNLWMGVYFAEDQRVGFVHVRTLPAERDGEPGYELHVVARVTFPLFGLESTFHLSGGAFQSAMRGLRHFDFTFRSGDYDMRAEGAVRDGRIEARLHTAGEQVPFSLPVGRDILLTGGLGLDSLSLPQLSIGKPAYVDTFDPTTMSVGRARVEALRRETLQVAGEPVETLVIAVSIGGITTHAWLNEMEEVVRAETPFGLVIKKITPEEALSPMRPDESANIVRSLAVDFSGKVPDPAAAAMRVRLLGLDEKLMPPEDARQRREGMEYVLSRVSPDMIAASSPEPEELDAALVADAFVQAGHPRIRELAQSIVEGAPGAWEKALRLYQWVYENLEKTHVLSVPSALEVLQSRKGDCNEHAVLFTALARSLEIPTRIAIGLAWSEKMRAFGYHAWVEVYAGDWIAMDPTLGEEVVGPTHLKFFNGSIEQWPRLLPYIGLLEIEVLEIY